ncbi:MAG: hypothetical protein HFE84_02475 [Lachnospiraceae bacterium]|nr:hypothetical protein [Lachnospiraceae bacterium]
MGKRFSSADLKLLAMGAMAIDHAAYVWMYGSEYAASLPKEGICMAMRLVGRMAFPLFAFLLVEGFLHTKDWKRYAARLLAAAVVSELPYNLVVENSLSAPKNQNTLFLLLVGLLTLKGISRAGRLCACLTAIAGFTAAWLFRMDYGPVGLLLVLVFYFFRQNPPMRTRAGILTLFFLYGPDLMWPAACTAFFFMNRYSQERGKRLGCLPYVFYPVHLSILYFTGGILHGAYI